MTITDNSRFSVIGYGSWATTIVGQLISKGNVVNWHILNPEVADCVVSEGYNPKYVSDLELDRSLLKVSDDINEVVSNGDIIVLACPSSYLESTLSGLNVDLSGKFFLSAIKGIIPSRCMTVIDYVYKVLGVPMDNIGLFSGPTHAEEVSRGKLSFLMAACPSMDDARCIASRLGSNSLRVTPSTDVRGIEFASIFKNIYALAAGLAAGLGYGDNFQAVLVSACARETMNFLDLQFPSHERDVCACSYLGDLLVTSYSNYSRNRRLGLLIGRGCSVKSALNEMTMVAEGYYAVECAHRLLESRPSVQMPIAEAVYLVLYQNARPRRVMEEIAKNVL